MTIERELDLNRKVGPFLAPPLKHFTGSPLGAILKKHSAPVKWRKIHLIVALLPFFWYSQGLILVH